MRGRSSIPRVFLLAFVVLAAWVGCATNAPEYSAPRADSETIFVVPGAADAAYPYEGPTDFALLYAEYLAGELQGRGISALAVPRDASPPEFARHVVYADLITVDPGSWNLRFWIGFGAGRAFIRSSVSLEDLERDETVFQDEYQARSTSWQFQENALRRTLSKIARVAAGDLAAHLRSRGR